MQGRRHRTAGRLPPRPRGARRLRHRRRAPLQRPLRRAAAGALLAGAQRAQPEPLLQSAVRSRPARLAGPLPPADQRLLLRGESASTAPTWSSPPGSARSASPATRSRRCASPACCSACGGGAAASDPARLRRRRPLRHLRHPPLHDRRARPTTATPTTSRSATSASSSDCCAPPTGRADQGRVPAHAAVGHRVLLGLRPARPGRPADADPRPLDGRGAAHRLARRRQPLLLVQPARPGAEPEPPVQRNARVRPLLPRRDARRRRPQAPALRLPLPLRRLRAGGRDPVLGTHAEQPRRPGRDPAPARRPLAHRCARPRRWRRDLQGRRDRLRPPQARLRPRPSTAARPRSLSRCVPSRTSTSRPSAEHSPRPCARRAGVQGGVPCRTCW